MISDTWSSWGGASIGGQGVSRRLQNRLFRNVPGGPFRIGDWVRVMCAADETFDHQFMARQGCVSYLEYSCGCGQSFPEDPMIGVAFAGGIVEEFWKEELCLISRAGARACAGSSHLPESERQRRVPRVACESSDNSTTVWQIAAATGARLCRGSRPAWARWKPVGVRARETTTEPLPTAWLPTDGRVRCECAKALDLRWTSPRQVLLLRSSLGTQERTTRTT